MPDDKPFDEAEAMLADMEGVEAVYEGRRLAAQKNARGEARDKPAAEGDKPT